MEHRYTLQIRELVVYSFLVFGVLLDQFSTRYGLSLGFVEANPLAHWLMGTGLWFIVDLLLILIIAGLTVFLSKKLENNGRILLIYPLLFGLVRASVGLRNLNLIF
jgi:hypothetical protein